MKNIQTGSNEHHNHLNPHLVSDARDMTNLASEGRLRAVANAMPSQVGNQPVEVVQGSIATTVYAVHDYLTQLVSALTINTPDAASIHEVSASGFNLLDLSEHALTSQCPMPEFPVVGYINRGKHNGAPKFGEPVLEPTICLAVNHSGDVTGDVFRVRFTLPTEQDIQALQHLQADCGESWAEFESRFGIKPLHDAPLTLNVAFNQDGPLHKPLVAAITLLECLTWYKEFCIDKDEKEDEVGLITKQLQNAIVIDNDYKLWRSENMH